MRVAVYAHVAASLATCDQCDLCFRVCLSLDLLCPLAHECPAGEYNGYVPPHCLSLVKPDGSWCLVVVPTRRQSGSCVGSKYNFKYCGAHITHTGGMSHVGNTSGT